MPAPNAQYQVQEVPIQIAGGTHYGRYPKISDEQTWNCIVSDGFLVPYAGYKRVVELSSTAEGRGIYTSYRGNFILVISGQSVYRLNYNNGNFQSVFIGSLETNTGDVYIAENNNGQIAITDTHFLYVYNWQTPTTPVLESSAPGGGISPFPPTNPGYISFQNGQLILASEGTTSWYLSEWNNAKSWPATAAFVGSIQSKPDFIQAVVPVPGGASNVVVFGHNVAEMWQSTGNALFPYQKNVTFNSDYGCINPSTIASLKDTIVWIGLNEQSGPVLMSSKGNTVTRISTDGIDFKIGNLTNPDNCTGFLFQQDGHLIYQFTFPDDNLSYAYDFNTELFFCVSDENLNYHIARQVVYFGPTNDYYFVSFNSGNVYEFNSDNPDAEYSPDDIGRFPRIRITAPFRLPTQRMFIVKSFGFTIEQGQPNIVTQETHTTPTTYTDLLTEGGDFIATEEGDLISTEATGGHVTTNSLTTSESKVYLAISRNGAESFGNFYPKDMNATGNYKSRLIWQRLGQANDVTFQVRFNGPIRWVCTDGLAEIFQ
jgi:hypothetical protein